MADQAFRDLASFKGAAALLFGSPGAAYLLCPDMGGRVFAELNGHSMHRLDLAAVRRPDQPFANYGGCNVWPAPEGGPLGFNYRGTEWYVQPAINREPFTVEVAGSDGARLAKTIELVNRAGVHVATRMERLFERLPGPPPGLPAGELAAGLAYRTTDRFTVLNTVDAESALLAAWTLEQFDACDETVAFAAVDEPEAAINEAYYDPPRERLAFYPRGFTYRVDGRKKGQIGIRQAAEARFIGCYDLSRRLLVLRWNAGPAGGLYFNIADNDQPGGPRSAADAYSIFNSDPDMAAFELETIGAARLEGRRLAGSELISVTALAEFRTARDLRAFVGDALGGGPGAA